MTEQAVPTRDIGLETANGGSAVDSGAAGAASDAASREARLLEEDGTIVEITVSHGSLEEADYALMVATYQDETLSGPERFLDLQLNGLLSSSFDAGFYPGELGGKSLFLRPHPVVGERTSPPGAYVIGLGRSVDLSRPRVRHAVGQALLERCLQLETYPSDDADGELREVGVSTTLLGVRNADGLSVTESVGGIVEGVLDANRGLVRYEAARHQAGNPVRCPLRIVALEFIERFAERADLTALVLRNLPNTVRLRTEYHEALKGTVVTAKPGGLAAGAALVDSPENWRRFSITTLTPSDQLVADATTITFDVSFLGGDARADRTQHRLDRLAIDALSQRLSTATDDAQSAATLYDMLVPEQLRHHFLTSSSVQLIVDQTSANYPWELLSAPRSSGDAALAAQMSVVRQFSETAERRLVVERASRGTALVIAAGKVPGQTTLSGAHQEGLIVAELLAEQVSTAAIHHIDDRDSAPDTVTLVNALDGDHQILHIASHGEYVAEDPAATGALLNETFRLRVETVRQLRHVPDLVFLNCCYLGRVGTSRLAAGLAREFMAIGARAVIAAGWDVGDTAAAEFARSFYQCFLDGATFADAVATARLASMKSGGRETWAAYQCYGDPMLVFDGSSSGSRSIETDPVSSEDLIRRLKTLRIQSSDLGRPGSGKLNRRRTQYLETYRRLARWAQDNGMLEPRNTSDDNKRGATGCRRHLARVAAELGEFAIASGHYLALLNDPEQPLDDRRRRRWRRWASVEDLQQASNCLSRSAQHKARADDDAVRAECVAQLERAVELAREALDLSREPESYGILGGALKRLATVAPVDERAELIKAAAYAYERRDEPGDATTSVDPSGEESSPYTRNTSAQLALLIDPTIPLPQPGPPPAAATDAPPMRIDGRAPRSSHFWAAAAKGDERLTRLLAGPGDLTNLATEMVAAYQRAFEGRSTWRERASSIDHLRDLADLLGSDDPRRTAINGAIDALESWESDHEETAPALTAVTAPATTARARPADTVVVTAIPAGPGDCILVEYGHEQGARHRLLIDGGLGKAFDEGLGAFARSQPGGRLDVDFLVVTHIDNDHILGAVKALEHGLVDARDVWFNGLAELEGLDTRAPKQGDQLSALIPNERRNQIVDGAALQVPDTGPLPVLTLPGGARCTLLTPNRGRLDKLRDRWKLTTARGTEARIADLEALIDQDDTGRGQPGYGKDTSVTNASSIAFLFEHDATAALFTGDAFAGDLTDSLDRLLHERLLSRLPIDLFKLSHHGSINNITPELLQRLDVRGVLVCTDGHGHHPDEETIRLLAALPQPPRVWFAGNGNKIRTAAKLVTHTEIPDSATPVTIAL